MKHNMKLDDAPFRHIKSKEKTIEMRLYDEKRRLINIDDIIEFTNRETEEIISAKVIGLHKFSNFKELYPNFDKISLGYLSNEEANPEDMYEYYSKEEQDKYGVLGIEIELLK